jgi:hypothetical protein
LKTVGYNIYEHKANEILIIKNEISNFVIEECLKVTNDPKPYLWAKVPLYLFYEEFNIFVEYMQISDFSKLLGCERLVFLFGTSQIDLWFNNMQSLIPNFVLNAQGENDLLYQKINKIDTDKSNTFKTLKDEVRKYYEDLDFSEIADAFRKGNPRIMFMTTRFSTAIQYFIRDCVEACNKLHIPNYLCIDVSDIHRCNQYDWIKTLADFRPHAIFIIDHFRWEYPDIPDNIIFISWTHDLLPNILSKSSAERIKEKDFILNLIPNYKKFKEADYPKDQTINTPIPVNNYIFKSYKLTKEEIDNYETEICVISNPGNPKEGLSYVLDQIKENLCYKDMESALKSAYSECYNLIYNGQPFYDDKQHEELITRWFYNFNITASERFFSTIIDMFKIKVIWNMYRSVPIEWLKEKGYKIKLWGREWLDHPNLKEYAMGVAQNGEKLSKILNASKIMLGTNPALSAHPRVFEATMSNCLYIGINIPSEYDVFDIREFLEEDKGIIFFYNKEDLYKKVDYYMNHLEKRMEVINNGKSKILSELTYEKMMTKVIDEIGSRINKRRDK